MPTDDNALAENIWGVWGSNKNLRHEFMWRYLGWSLARQIREMRKARGWSRAELARRSDLTEQTIVRCEKSCCQASINSLVRIAAGFDVALVCHFGPFSELLVVMSSGAVIVPRTFEEEFAATQAGDATTDDESGAGAR